MGDLLMAVSEWAAGLLEWLGKGPGITLSIRFLWVALAAASLRYSLSAWINLGRTYRIVADEGIPAPVVVFMAFLLRCGKVFTAMGAANLLAGVLAFVTPLRPDAYNRGSFGLIEVTVLITPALLLFVAVCLMHLARSLDRVYGDLTNGGRRTHDGGNGGSSHALQEVQAMRDDMAEIHAASAPPPGGPGAAPLEVTIVQNADTPVPVIVETPVPVIVQDDGKPKE